MTSTVAALLPQRLKRTCACRSPAKPAEKFIARAAVPLEVAAKASDRKLRIKSIRHIDCVEVGHDRFDEVVTDFLGKIGEVNIVSIHTDQLQLFGTWQPERTDGLRCHDCV